jgi:nucleoside-diphosphate-sugar epimerase
MGAITPVSYSFLNPIEVNRNNYMGSLNLAEAAREALPHLKGFLFASSMEVFGEQPEELKVFDEKTEPHPLAPYAVSKRAFEIYLELLWRVYKFPAVSIRQTNAYGRESSKYFIVEAIVTQMLDGKTVNLGRKAPVRNFIHIDDLCDFYMTMIGAIEHKITHPNNIFGQVFCTGPANGLNIEELAIKIADLMKWSGVINWNTKEIRAGEVMRLNSSHTKATAVIRWSPKISLEEGLKRVIRFWGNKKMAEVDKE